VHLAVDGWTLVERPWSAEALQLVESLEVLTSDRVDLRLSLIHPAGPLPLLPSGVERHPIAVPLSPWGGLRYEQRELPRRARALGADLLFVPRPAAALTPQIPVAVLLHDPERACPASVLDRAGQLKAGLGRGTQPAATSLLGRLRRALGTAGASGAALRLRLDDLPSGRLELGAAAAVPPLVSAAFGPTSDPDPHPPFGLTPGYVLSCGVSPEHLPLLLAAWTWVEGSVGEAAPLVLFGIHPAAERKTRARAEALGMESTVKVLPPPGLADLPGLFRAAAGFISVGLPANGQPLRWALSSGVPVAGISQAETASVLGDAGYLTPPGDARALGAACLTLLVEAGVASSLRQMGLDRAARYHGREPALAWMQVFGQAVP
jgi:hypothetical protein